MTEDSGYLVQSSCVGCLLRNKDLVTCEAFPKGIPALLLSGALKHDEPFDVGGVSDGGVTRVSQEDFDALDN